ncbi:hypothetical protein GO003_009060 [Methylicorpusculum oleiharenae]|uniref:hypothetical protein n=1 Tax=Methylicorpusculum oleiharenae TaxID=1338687 RepID=UPI00135C4A57|nr:hypothetical protein [Methylicorpusculum oleiharenae]MCD2450537.1 hypothetical protein [Methylicorpusculum oleiharenae]
MKIKPTCAAMGHLRQAHSRLGIRTPRQDENLKHQHHIRLDAPDTPMDNHRRRLKTERRPKSDQGDRERSAEKFRQAGKPEANRFSWQVLKQKILGLILQ